MTRSNNNLASERGPLAHGDSLMFAERVESKYFLKPAKARAFADGLTARLGIHRFRGPDANTLPRPVHYVTSLYFDTTTQEIARACEEGTENVKLRAREYYDDHPELAELATTDSQTIRRAPLVWLEVKTRTDASTRKVRFSMPTAEVSTFMSEGVISAATLERQREAWGESADEVFDEIGQLCRQTEGSLRPDCLAHYRRRAWEDAEGELRVTLDTRLCFFRAPERLFDRSRSLRECVSGKPVARLTDFLVEVKLRRDVPDWLQALMDAAEFEPARDGSRTFSKFLAASHAVHGAE